MHNASRRTSLIALSGVLTGCYRAAVIARSSETLEKKSTDEDKALAYKYRGIRGGELRVDALVRMPPTALHRPNGQLFNIGTGSFRPGKSDISSYGGTTRGDQLVVPEYLRMMRYAEGSKRNLNDFAPPAYNGDLVYETTVPIAPRIPDAVLDRVRRYNGSLTLKLRLTLDTILVGWEVKNGRSYPFKLDKDGYAYETDEDTLPGGDFREAKRFNGKIVRKGWYIDPKTAQRVETDF